MEAKKLDYQQVKDHFHSIQEVALEVAHEALKPVLTNKKGGAVLRSDIGLSTLTTDADDPLLCTNKQRNNH